MPVACPNCGSRYLRESRPRDFSEKLKKLWFVSPVRCRDCKTRFIAQTIIVADLFYSRCPRCYRMDLNTWTGKHYETTFWAGVKIQFGANRWRCEYCRVNFASFRKRREIFTFSRWKNMNSAKARAEGRAKAAEAEAGNGSGDTAGPPV
jgi:DNA-directed RNA polymerase subunit RPC12/RpoP